MFERRDVLKAGLGAIAAGSFRRRRARGPPVTPPPPTVQKSAPFSRDMVVELARALAAKPYTPPRTDLPEPFANLSYEQFVGIKTKPDAAIWRQRQHGFQHRAASSRPYFRGAVDLYVVENAVAARLPYEASHFDYGALNVRRQASRPRLFGLSRAARPQMAAREAELAIFQGASFYRAVARGQNLGVTARGLSIRTADPRGEEFPAFRSFWIEKPALGDNALVIHALLDSPSVAGVYRFTLRPGEATLIDTELTLYPRTAIDHLGLARLCGGFAVYAARPRQARRSGGRWSPRSTACRCSPARTNGFGDPSRTAKVCNSPPSSTTIRRASAR